MFKQDFTCPVLLDHPISSFRVQGYHQLWRAFPDASAKNKQDSWAAPLSFATTQGISVDFFSSGY